MAATEDRKVAVVGTHSGNRVKGPSRGAGVDF
jgi:hypothetical protein